MHLLGLVKNTIGYCYHIPWGQLLHKLAAKTANHLMPVGLTAHSLRRCVQPQDISAVLIPGSHISL